MTTFNDLAIAPPFLPKLATHGFTEPTEIQQVAIPPILEGRDAILQSQTGSGKTLAYLLPLLSRIDPTQPTLQAVIVSPTRELGMQIKRVIDDLVAGEPIVAQQLIGGANIRHQVDRLKKRPHVVVGTPGRLAELIRMGKLKAHTVRALVVDEVDHVLDPTFKTDLIRVLKAIPRERQTLFASATVSPEVLEVSGRWMKEPVHLQVSATKLPPSLQHAYLVVDPRHKLDTFRKVLHATAPRAAIAFVHDPARSGELASKLSYKGLTVAALSGEAKKQERADVLKALRQGHLQVLVATEMAARGLDIPELTHVYNVDLPTDADHYLHRAGRAGRMGRPGLVLTLITERERFVVDKIAKALGIEIHPARLDHGELRVEAAESLDRSGMATDTEGPSDDSGDTRP